MTTPSDATEQPLVGDLAPSIEQDGAEEDPVATRKPLPRYVSYRGMNLENAYNGAASEPVSGDGDHASDRADAFAAKGRRERLLELKALMDEGLIDAEDFQAQKSRVLGQI